MPAFNGDLRVFNVNVDISVCMLLILTLSFSPPVVYLLFFHLSFIMFVWSYWKTIFTKPASPSKEVQ